MSAELPPETIPEHRLVRRIGRGSSGEVWLGQHSLGAWRAIKIVRPSGDGDRTNLRRELEGLRRYEPVSREHPALLDILTAGTAAPTGSLYYVMELADDSSGAPAFDPETYRAATLGRRMRAVVEAPGGATGPPLPVAEVIGMGWRLAEGLAALHAAGLVHRDIKPGNIVFVRGQACLADCGLVSTSEFARSFVGTEGFIPPEGPGQPPADVFGLGKSLYEAAFGMDRCDWPRLPVWFGCLPGWNDGLGDQYLGLMKVLRVACEQDRNRRFQSASAMASALRAVRLGQDPTEQHWGGSRTWRTGLIAGGVGLLLFVGWKFLFRSGGFETRSTQVVLNDPAMAQVVRNPKPSSTEAAFYQISGANVLLLDERGHILRSTVPPGPMPEGLIFQGMSEVSVGNGARMWLAWKSGADCLLGAFYPSMDHAVILSTPSMVLTNSNGLVRYPSKLDFHLVCDLDGDGRLDAVATLDSVDTNRDGALPERRLIAFDLETRKEKWKRPGPVIRPGSVRLLRGKGGRPILVAGTYAPSNGQYTPEGLEDHKCYAVAFDSEGKVVWKKYIGPYFSNGWVQPVLWLGSSEAEIYALACRNGDFVRSGREWGAVYRFRLDGKELNRSEPGPALTSALVRERGEEALSAQEGILVTDADGNVTLLSRDLGVVRQQSLTQRRLKRVFSELVGEADLNGDGIREVVVVVAQCQPHAIHMNEARAEAVNAWHYEEVDLVILDPELRELDRFRIADVMGTHPEKIARLIDLEGSGRHSIVLMERQPRILRWRGR